MNVNLEFNSKFDNEDYIITIQSNGKVLSISVEDEDRGVYWKKEYDEKVNLIKLEINKVKEESIDKLKTN